MSNRVSELFDLSGKHALVTGGGNGLGRVMAQAIMEAGGKVAVIGRSESILGMANAGFVPVRGDLTSDAVGLVDQAVEKLGGLDILVTAHGTALRSPAESFPRDDWDQTLITNLTSVMTTIQAAAQGFLRQGHGKIINMASMLSFSGGLNACAYSASKGGVAQLTKALANEWASRGINVNAIAPGYFATAMTEPIRQDAKRNMQILDRLPAGKWGDPKELAGAVVFLASSASDYIHGIILPVDGGWLAR